jgi:tetratricopeptide (TPR) repeat protein
MALHGDRAVIRLADVPRPSTRTLLVVAVAVLVAAGVGGLAWWWTSIQAGRGAALYAAAVTQAQQAQGSQATAEARATAAAALESALAQFPSAAMAAQAAYELGNLRWAQRDWARARAAYEVAAARSASPTLTTLARVAIGYTWEAEKNYPKALEGYQRALEGRKPGDFHYADTLVDVARIHELAGRKAEAIETYKRLLKEAPQNLRADDVKSRLASLGASL